MNHHESKFLLRAYRPDGADAADPIFAEPLAQATRDPLLRQWLEREQAFDAAVAAKLHAVAPPVDLRDAILAGARVSRVRRSLWVRPVWLAAAAAVAIFGIVAFGMRFSGADRGGARAFAALAIDDIAHAHDAHAGDRPGMTAVQARLAGAALPLPGRLAFNADELRRAGCRTMRLAGREVFELCFYRDGFLYHLYLAPTGGAAVAAADARAMVVDRDGFTAAGWADAGFTYALVTQDGVEALRRLI